MSLVRLDEWRQFLAEGDQYLGLARRARVKRPEVFTPEILYNLVAMAVEKYCMAFLMHHGQLADNHTMADLLAAMERLTGPLPDLAEKFRYLDSFQEICHLDHYQRRVPAPQDLDRMLAIGEDIQAWVQEAVAG